MGPMDYATGEGQDSMTVEISEVRRRVAEQQAQLDEALPGWQSWPIGTWDGRTLWSAQPAGAMGAVITDAASTDELIQAVRSYEATLPGHLADARMNLQACPPTGIGQDRAAVLRALISALEAVETGVNARLHAKA